MICPHCTGKKLETVPSRKGVLVDHCDHCGGTWLDKGELFFFTRNTRRVKRLLDEAVAEGKQGDRLSPRTGRPMLQIPLFSKEVIIDYCEDSGGLWFDKDELNKVLDRDKGLKGMEQRESSKEDEEVAHKKRRRLAAISSHVTPLPNLVSRSVFTLGGLYAMLTAVLIAASLYMDFPPAAALGIGVVFAALQFLLGPFIMDITLRWFYQMSWADRSRLPEHLTRFLDRVCAENKMKFPRIGVINDGAPNAFTYGHTPGNARIVITAGLMDLLSPAELEAVVAHEVGHAKHWDMAIMTMANLVPLVMYYVYRTLISVRSGGNDKSAGPRIAIAVGAYIVYIVSEYLVLWFSRTREYYADRFGGEATGNPNSLASALVRIAYGLAGQKGTGTGKKGKSKNGEARSSNLEAIGALGIFDGTAARALAVTSTTSTENPTGEIDKENLKGAMRWDRWNPWAMYYELHSTHPLVANRLEHLGEQSAAMGKDPFVVFTDRKPESYWDEFAVDLLMMWLPLLMAVPVLAFGLITGNQSILFLTLSGIGAGMFLKTIFSYSNGPFPEMSVASLLKYVKVSAVRPVPCTLRGKIIGRGVPGLIWSEDFVMQDETGIIFLDYRQPLRIWEFFFGLLRSRDLQDQPATITGWYRRSPMPYIELKTLDAGGVTRNCYVYHMKVFASIAAVVLGIVLMFSV